MPKVGKNTQEQNFSCSQRFVSVEKNVPAYGIIIYFTSLIEITIHISYEFIC